MDAKYRVPQEDSKSAHGAQSRSIRSTSSDSKLSSDISSNANQLHVKIGSVLQAFRIFKVHAALQLVFSTVLVLYFIQSLCTPLSPYHPGLLTNDAEQIISWIFSLIKTLGSSFVPLSSYVIIVCVAAGLEVALLLLVIVLQAWSTAGGLKGSSNILSRLKYLCQVALFINFLFIIPGTYAISTFLNCDYQTMDILRDGSSTCWTFTNTNTGVYALISIVALVLQTFFASLWISVSQHSDPSSRLSLFSMNTPFLLMLDVVICAFHNVFFEVLPIGAQSSQVYAWIPYVSFTAVQLFLFAHLLRAGIPFYRSTSNSFYGGIIIARIGISILLLVAKLVGEDVSLVDAASWGLFGGFAVFIIVAAVICFVIGFVIIQIYQNVMVAKLARQLAQFKAAINAEETEAEDNSDAEKTSTHSRSNHADQEPDYPLLKTSHVLVALKVLLGKTSGLSSEALPRLVEDLSSMFEMAHRLKAETHLTCDLNIIYQLYVADMPMYVMILLQKSIKMNKGFFNRIVVMTRQTELEQFAQEGSMFAEQRTARSLKSLNLKKMAIQSLVMQFFKTIMAEREKGDKMSSTKFELDMLVESLHRVRSSTKTAWANLLEQNKENSTIFRAYAQFAEDVDNDHETYLEMMQQADEIDASRARNKARRGRGKNDAHSNKMQQSYSLNRRATSKVHPVAKDHETMSQRNNSHVSVNSFVRKSNSTNGLMQRAASNVNIEEQDRSEALDSQDIDQQITRDQVFREAVQEQTPRVARTVFVISVLFLIVATLTTTFGLTIGLIEDITPPDFLFEVCQTALSPLELLRSLRLAQNSNTGAIIPSSQAPYYAFYIYKSIQYNVDQLDSLLTNHEDTLKKSTAWTDSNMLLRLPQHYVNLTQTAPSVFVWKNSSAYEAVRLYHTSSSRLFEIVRENLGFSEEEAHSIKMKDFVPVSDPLRTMLRNHDIDLSVDDDTLYQNYDFMMLFLNHRAVHDILDQECLDHAAEYEAASNTKLPILVSVLAALVILQVVVAVSFVIVVWSTLRERGKLIEMLWRLLGKDTKAKIYQAMEEKLAVETKNNQDIAHKLDKFKLKSRMPPGCFILVIYFFMLLIEVSLLAASIVCFLDVLNSQFSKFYVSHHADLACTKMSEMSILAMEYFYNPNHRLFSLLEAEEETSVESVQGLINEMLSTVDEDLNIAIYGKGTGEGLADSSMASVDQLISTGSCTKGSNDSVMASHEAVFGNDCLDSFYQTTSDFHSTVESIMSTFGSIQMTSEERAHANLNDPTSESLKPLVAGMYQLASVAIEELEFMMSEFSHSKQATDQYSGILTAVYVVELCVVLLLSVAQLILVRGLFHRNYWLRRIFIYIPLTVIEQNPYLRDYVYNHSIAGSLKQDSADSSAQAKSLTVMQAAIDGVLIVAQHQNHAQIVEINHSALQLFDTRQEQLIGKHLAVLFSDAHQQQVDLALRQVMGVTMTTAIKDKSKGSDGKESSVASFSSTKVSLEIDCKRKDGSMFPARVAFSAGMLDGKPVATLFIRDLTIERKSAELLAIEKANSEKLLLNVIPAHIAVRLKNGEQNIADSYEDTSVLFSDLAGFTAMSSNLTSSELIVMLNTLVSGFDDLTIQLGVEKIKTIGDAFFAIGGLDPKQKDHPERVVRLGIGMFKVLAKYNVLQRPSNIPPLNMRIGVHTGPVSAGIIGTLKYMFDCFGDTVNVASRMESTGTAGKVQCSRQTYERTYDLFPYKERTGIEVKGKGTVSGYIVDLELHDMEQEVIAEHQSLQQDQGATEMQLMQVVAGTATSAATVSKFQ